MWIRIIVVFYLFCFIQNKARAQYCLLEEDVLSVSAEDVIQLVDEHVNLMKFIVSNELSDAEVKEAVDNAIGEKGNIYEPKIEFLFNRKGLSVYEYFLQLPRGKSNEAVALKKEDIKVGSFAVYPKKIYKAEVLMEIDLLGEAYWLKGTVSPREEGGVYFTSLHISNIKPNNEDMQPRKCVPHNKELYTKTFDVLKEHEEKMNMLLWGELQEDEVVELVNNAVGTIYKKEGNAFIGDCLGDDSLQVYSFEEYAKALSRYGKKYTKDSIRINVLSATIKTPKNHIYVKIDIAVGATHKTRLAKLVVDKNTIQIEAILNDFKETDKDDFINPEALCQNEEEQPKQPLSVDKEFYKKTFDLIEEYEEKMNMLLLGEELLEDEVIDVINNSVGIIREKEGKLFVGDFLGEEPLRFYSFEEYLKALNRYGKKYTKDSIRINVLSATLKTPKNHIYVKIDIAVGAAHKTRLVKLVIDRDTIQIEGITNDLKLVNERDFIVTPASISQQDKAISPARGNRTETVLLDVLGQHEKNLNTVAFTENGKAAINTIINGVYDPYETRLIGDFLAPKDKLISVQPDIYFNQLYNHFSGQSNGKISLKDISISSMYNPELEKVCLYAQHTSVLEMNRAAKEENKRLAIICQGNKGKWVIYRIDEMTPEQMLLLQNALKTGYVGSEDLLDGEKIIYITDLVAIPNAGEEDLSLTLDLSATEKKEMLDVISRYQNILNELVEKKKPNFSSKDYKEIFNHSDRQGKPTVIEHFAVSNKWVSPEDFLEDMSLSFPKDSLWGISLVKPTAEKNNGSYYVIYDLNIDGKFSESGDRLEAKRRIATIGKHKNGLYFIQQIDNYDARQERKGNSDNDGDGVIAKFDKCPDEKGSQATFGCPDQDGDLVIDREDNCPEQRGTRLTNGCPDSDYDGIVDANDDCPFDYGKVNGCPDTDGDNIIDINDDCYDVYGPASSNGCPDTDEDGVPNTKDNCPYEKGEKRFDGCPDTDGDEIVDRKDLCPYEKGSAYHNGCPDTDGDNIINKYDDCPTAFGLLVHNGCPDTDGDAIRDIDDACPDLAGDKWMDGIAKGCPDVDGDLIADNQDECPCVMGTKKTNGCPGYGRRVYLGVNYQFFSKSQTGLVWERVERDFSKPDFSKFEIALYAPIGFFFSNFHQQLAAKPHTGGHSIEALQHANQVLSNQNPDFVPAVYQKTQARVTGFDLGFYAAPFYKHQFLHHLHFKLGMSFLMGEVWDEYTGDLGTALESEESGLYIVDRQNVTNQSFIVGAALVWPFFQMEAGYNHLYKDYFVKAGINIPFGSFHRPTKSTDIRKKRRAQTNLYFRRVRIGLNYSFLQGNPNYYKELTWQRFSNDVQEGFTAPKYDRFGVSFYAPVGLFFSNFSQNLDPAPQSTYSYQEAERAMTVLENRGESFTALTRLGTKSRTTAFNIGVYISPFPRTKFLHFLHFMVGTSILQGYAWDEYGGDLKGELSFSRADGMVYALDHQTVNNNNFILGLAVVLPFFQIEGGYNHLYREYFVNAGINIPLGIGLKRKKY